MNDSWQSGNPYEQFMGRWSTLVARQFLEWLEVPRGGKWVDVGCGTGALTLQVLERYQPAEVVSIDSSSEFIAHARQTIPDKRAQFRVGLAQSLELPSNSVDAVVSGLVLNFVPEPETAVAEMMRVTKSGGKVGIFLWDYAEGMEMLRYFWDAAVALNSGAAEFDEGIRFPLCQKGQLEALARASNLKQVEAVPVEVITKFKDFDDYWTPFLGQVGPAPSYTTSLSDSDRQALQQHVRDSLPIAQDGSISIMARAWAVKGVV